MNAQSRLFEEGLLRLRLPYLVVGGVGFYERKEVKDVLAYLRLVLNPRDAVAFRRVVNVPPRGIGAKTVEEIDRVAAARGREPVGGGGAPRRRGGAPRAGPRAAAAVPGDGRDAARGGRAGRRPRRGLRGLIERVLELSGYGAALAREDSQESQDRLENLAELLAAAVDYEAREEAPSLAGFLDRAALALRDRPPARRRAGAAHDPPRRQGAGVRVGLPGRAGGGPPAPLAQPHRRGRARGGAPALLRGHDPRHGAAPPVLGPQPPGVRPAARDRAEPLPRGDPGGGPGEERRRSSAVPPRPRRGAATLGRRPRGPRRAAPAPGAPAEPMRPGCGCATRSSAWGPCCGARATATTSR